MKSKKTTVVEKLMFYSYTAGMFVIMIASTGVLTIANHLKGNDIFVIAGILVMLIEGYCSIFFANKARTIKHQIESRLGGENLENGLCEVRL